MSGMNRPGTGPPRLGAADPRDIRPEAGRARYADGPGLHQLRHSSGTRLDEANVSASVIMAETGPKSRKPSSPGMNTLV